MLSARQFYRNFSTARTLLDKMKIAIIGQSTFGQEVYKLLQKNGHEIVGVFTVPDIQGKPDPLAVEAEKSGTRVFKFPRWRMKGLAIPEVVEQYKQVGAELNVMPFCSQFIPMEVIDAPQNGSIIYHPSILPRHRGASAINWTLIMGDNKAGFTIFWADEGLDTGPILLQRECDVEPNDTVDSLYNRFLYPEGIKAMGEAVDLIYEGKAPKIIQPEEGATYEKLLKKTLVQIDWNQTAEQLHNFIRGNDKIPGAWTKIDDQTIAMFGATLYTGKPVVGTELSIEGLPNPAMVHKDGIVVHGSDGKMVNIKSLQFEDGRMIHASKYGASSDAEDQLELTDEEKTMAESIRGVWASILNFTPDKVDGGTDFFKSGAGSMDVARLVEEVKQKCGGIEILNEDVYMATVFDDFIQMVVRKNRGEGDAAFEFDAVEMNVNDIDLSFPHQIFINNEFMDAESGKEFETINPTDETVICKVSLGGAPEINKAVAAAKAAFDEGEWGRMNPRDRGKLMFKLADLMDAHKEELATLESIDSGAVYTLAIKTHVGMSVDTFRYFAGWCDKIHGQTIPLNHARPNRNLTFTKKEPYGVCGIIIPWNYPLMMLAWKMAACLAAGNTVVLKPAQVTPLTALKFAELTVKAGFPPGVINIVPGAGSVIGNSIVGHKDVRKVGFTGSTGIGQHIMKGAAMSNLKKVSLELGGKSPLIIFSDADMDKAVRQGIMGCFFNKGENCIAAGRLFVDNKIHDEFVEKVVAEVKKMKIGDPLDRATAHGPQNHRAHLVKLLEYVETGVKEGAKLIYGGNRLDRKGFFMVPAIFTDVQDQMTIAIEESFGPVMVISRFDESDVDSVLARANATEFGLASGVFTRDINKAMYVAEKLQAGTVFVNCYNKTDVAVPFGGYKQSGFGKDLGEEALHEYLRVKAVTLEY